MAPKKTIVSKKALPITFQPQLRDTLLKRLESPNILNCCPGKLHLHSNLLELIHSHISSNQLEILKKLKKIIQTSLCLDCMSAAVEILLHGLYYSSAENQSLTSAVIGVLNNVPLEYATHVSNMIDFKLQTTTIEINSVAEVLWFAALLQLDIGQQALSISSTPLIIIDEVLQKLVNLVSDTSSGIGKVEVFTKIHFTIKTLHGLIKLKNKNAHHEDIKRVLLTLIKIMNLKGLPVEPLGNCSNILLTYLIHSREDWLDIINAKLGDELLHSNCILDKVDQTPLTKLNISLALLACLDNTTLLGAENKREIILGSVLLPFLLRSYEGLSDTTQALLAARLLENWLRKCLECFDYIKGCDNLLANQWLVAREKLLDMTSMGLEHQVDAVRHSAKNALLTCIKIHHLLNENLSSTVEAVLKMPRFKKAKYIILSCFAQSDLRSVLLMQGEKLARELYEAAEDPAIASQAKEVYELLLFHDVSMNKVWIDYWLYPLLEVVASNPGGSIFDSTLAELLRIRPEIIIFIKAWYENDHRKRLPVYVLALLACKKQGVVFSNLTEEFRDNISPEGIHQVVLEAIDQHDGRVRVNAIGIIIEGPKKTQQFSKDEFECIKKLIVNDKNNSNPAFRQQLCALIKKFLIKLRDGGTYLLYRKEKVQVIEDYRAFIVWFVDNCLKDLGPGLGFSRRFFSLQFLKFFNETFGIGGDPNGLVQSPIFSLPAVISLIECLYDSYDVNKEVALELLCSPVLVKYVDEHPERDGLIEIYFKSSLSSCQSFRSTNTSAATFCFRWMIHLIGVHEGSQLLGEKIKHETTLLERNTYFIINKLMTILEPQINSAKQNLDRLAIDSPIYGILASIRLLLSDLHHIENFIEKGSWKSLILEIVDKSFEASAIASPVVTSDSPEGFLPNNFENVSSQALLVSAWRIVKEVTLLFGQLSLWSLKTDPPLVEKSVIIKMGLHLKELLLETKHRGAFEQVYTGFTLYCNALWKSPVQSLHRLPETWLLDVIHILKDSQLITKLCATRRSAGLPFMFQAILSPEVGRGELFSTCMDALLEVGSSGSPESRLHCLNILRNLYRESRFNQLIGPYVARGLILSITGFEAADWPERNSSTLLFSALMTRIFGVPRSKTDFQKKNSLTGRMFFQLYPQLYEFLLGRLQQAAEDILSKKTHLHPSLFPLLILVGRLQPPAGEASISPFDLAPFVSLVRKCGASPVFKTRQLAAQALTPLLTVDAALRLLPELFDSIATCTSQNELHGNLLQIHHLVREVSQHGQFYESVFHVLNEKLHDQMCLLKSSCSLIRYEYASILELVDPLGLLNGEFKHTVSQLCMDELNSGGKSQISIQPFFPLFCEKIAKLLVNTRALSSINISHLMNHPIEEVRNAVMEYIIRTEPTFDINEIRRPSLSDITNSKENSLRSRCLYIELIGSSITNVPRKLELLLSIYRKTTDDILRCTVLTAAVKNLESWQTCNVNLLNEFSIYVVQSTKGSVTYRHAAVKAVFQLKFLMLLSDVVENAEKWESLSTNLWTALLRFLLDDDENIRELASSIVTGICHQESIDIHPVVALDLCLQTFVNHVGSRSSDSVISALAAIILAEEEWPEIDCIAFEKENNDTYWEPVSHSIILCDAIKQCAAKNQFTKKNLERLASTVRSEWEKTSKISEEISNAHHSRLREFVLIRKIKLFFLTNSLKTYNEILASIHSDIRQQFQQTPLLRMNYFISQTNLSLPQQF